MKLTPIGDPPPAPVGGFYPQQQFPLWSLPAQSPALTWGWGCPQCRTVCAPWLATCPTCKPKPDTSAGVA